MICCRNCGQPFPLSQFPFRCPTCDGLFGFDEGLEFNLGDINPELQGIWRYRAGFSLPEGAPLVTLGEGNTPLVWSEAFGKRVAFKLESLNPTGSFKDRGTAVLVSWMLAAGVREAVEDSSGNAGASFAAYASRAGIQGKVFIPAYASGPKRAQIEAYGTEVIPVPGPRSKAAEAVLKEVDQGLIYASHAYLPQGTAGIATIAYELVEALGEPPGTVLIPVGHGSLLLGIWLGFQALLKCGMISHQPRLIGLQAQACDPLYRAFQAGQEHPLRIPEGKTLAEGVAIADPYHGEIVLAAVRESEGLFLHVDENRIEAGQKMLARLGIYAELTSALVWDGLRQLPAGLPEPIVCIITGHGLKSA
ncbi:MAG TPA: pyridoxal-phosphate dependent enzyme [Chloroflexi bacterium]|nr:pyridoxal-phosphate dependent enzyme [Chloroflexota bacterium]